MPTSCPSAGKAEGMVRALHLSSGLLKTLCRSDLYKGGFRKGVPVVRPGPVGAPDASIDCGRCGREGS